MPRHCGPRDNERADTDPEARQRPNSVERGRTRIDQPGERGNDQAGLPDTGQDEHRCRGTE
jgi:hypothetical protein